MNLTKSDIENTERKRRLNLINSVTGIKPANLIGSISDSGQMNLTVISSVVHLGSNPALIGFISRPVGEVPRHTYENIKQNGFYTINAIPAGMVEKAHYTSAKYEREVNEFERCRIKPEFIDGFKAPFVADSPIKLGMKLAQQIPIDLNGTILIIGSVERLIISDEIVNEKGYVDLQAGNIAGIGGLNTYYKFEQIGQFPYARAEEAPEFVE